MCLLTSDKRKERAHCGCIATDEVWTLELAARNFKQNAVDCWLLTVGLARLADPPDQSVRMSAQDNQQTKLPLPLGWRGYE
jgi:hypothetical protein